MPRYIDSDELRKDMYHRAFEEDSIDQKWDSGCWIRYHMFEDSIESIPTADVRENIHGEWIIHDEGIYTLYLCTNCKSMWTAMLEHSYVKNLCMEMKFCPKCGAMMNLRKEEEA